MWTEQRIGMVKQPGAQQEQKGSFLDCFPSGDYSVWGQKWDMGLSSTVLGDIMRNQELYI